MSLISIKNLTFTHEGSDSPVFENVSITLDTDWRLGLVGRNGKGKTTLLSLLMGKHGYQGSITKSVSMDYFPQEITNPSLTAAELFCEEEWRLLKELDLLKVNADCAFMPFKNLSGGEKVKVMLAALFAKDSGFLLIDEPTSHLDQAGRQVVKEYLQQKSGFILVSHDRDLLDSCTDHTLSLSRSEIAVYACSFSQYFTQKQDRDRSEQEQNRKLRQEIDRLKEASKRKSDWSDKTEQKKFGGDCPDRGFMGHKAAKVMKSAKVLENRQNAAIEQKSTLLKDIEIVKDIHITPLKSRQGALVSLSDLSISIGERRLFSGLNLQLNQGGRVALTGGNGSGKSTLMRLIMGGDINYTGSIVKQNGLKISFIPQDTGMVCGTLDTLTDGVDTALMRTILSRLDVSPRHVEGELSRLSEGQKKKLLIAISLSRPAHLYIWDEPLNYVDIYSRLQIEQVIVNSGLTVLCAEHDTAFLKAINAQTVALN